LFRFLLSLLILIRSFGKPFLILLALHYSFQTLTVVAFGKRAKVQLAFSHEDPFPFEFVFSGLLIVGYSNVFVAVLEQSFDEPQIFFLNFPKNSGLVF
jgi:hypothetical protein